MIDLNHHFECTADALWAIVGDPARSDWVPGVEALTMQDDVRRMQMAGAGVVAERITRRDDAARRLEYQVIESTPPLARHRASITVSEHDGGASMRWTTEVEPAAVERFIQASMAQCIARLEELTLGVKPG